MPPGFSSPGPCRVAKEDDQHHQHSLNPPPSPITLNDLLIIAWQLDIDQATKPAACREGDSRRPLSSRGSSSAPPLKRRKMSSSPPKRRRQDYELPDRRSSPPESDPNSTSSVAVIRTHLASASIAEADDTLTPTSFVSLVNKLAGSSTTPRTSTVDGATISTSTSYFPPPSRRSSQPASRPPSPSKGGDRQKRVTLEFTRPAFKFGWPALPEDKDVVHEEPAASRPTGTPPVPDHIASLIRTLSEPSVTPGCIPSSYAPLISKHTHSAEYVPPEAFSEPSTTESSTALFTHAHTLLTSAHRLHNNRAAESKWYLVVRSLLEGPPAEILEPTPANLIPQQQQPLLFIDEAQTWCISADLLPLAGPRTIGTVKVDFVIQYEREREGTAKDILDPIFFENPLASLSAFGDPLAAKTFTAGLVEVKSPSGDREEGEYQVVVAAAGVLARLEGLMQEAGKTHGLDTRMPVVGFVVQGHWWSLLVVYRESQGAVRVLGPFPAGNTATYLGIFQLMVITRRMKEWARTEYWEFLKGLVVGRGTTGGETDRSAT